MKLLLSFLTLITLAVPGLTQQRKTLPISSGIDVFGPANIRGRTTLNDTARVRVITYPDGTSQTTAAQTEGYAADSAAIKQTLRAITPMAGAYPADSAYIKSSLRTMQATGGGATNAAIHDSLLYYNLGKGHSVQAPVTVYVSLPNDPQTPGSDITGTGTAGAPFATVGKAIGILSTNLDGIITIKLDSGAFSLSLKDWDLIQRFTSGNLKFEGTFYNYCNVLSATCASVYYDPFKHILKLNRIVIADELRRRFLLNYESFYLPIASNSASAADSTTTVIHSNVTQIAPVGVVKIVSQLFLPATPRYNLNTSTVTRKIYFNNIEVCNDNSRNINFYSPFEFHQCYLRNIVIYNYCTTGESYISSTYCNYGFVSSGILYVYNSVFSNTAANQNYMNVFGGRATIDGNVITGMNSPFLFNRSANSGTNILETGPHIRMGANRLSDVPYGGARRAFRLATTLNLYLKGSVTYCDASSVSAFWVSLHELNISRYNVVADTSNFRMCNPAYKNNILWYELGINYHRPKPYTFIDNDYGFNFYIKGYDYPEYEKSLTFAMRDGGSDTINIGKVAYNQTIELKYTIKRATATRSGSIKVLNTGAGLLLDGGDYIENAPLGVTFTRAVLRGPAGAEQLIALVATTTATGVAPTFTYDAYRQNL